MPLYNVKWIGWDDTTWEPAANLVGAADSVRDYDEAEKIKIAAHKQQLADKAKKKREDDKAKMAEDEQARAAKALKEDEAMIAQAAEAGDNGEKATDARPKYAMRADGRLVMKEHEKKNATCFEAFDLLKALPTCLVNAVTNELTAGDEGPKCNHEIDPKHGTSNFWGHLYRHHRKVWLELKKKAGQLSSAGVVELAQLEVTLQERLAKGHGKDASQAAPPLCGEAQGIVNRLAGEWVVDTDQFENAAEKPAFKKLVTAISSGAWKGCCSKTISQEITNMASEGREDVKEFHAQLQADGRKPSMAVDLWSKNHQALLGGLSHGIIRPGDGRPWTMPRKLSACKACRYGHHTGDLLLFARSDWIFSRCICSRHELARVGLERHRRSSKRHISSKN